MSQCKRMSCDAIATRVVTLEDERELNIGNDGAPWIHGERTHVCTSHATYFNGDRYAARWVVICGVPDCGVPCTPESQRDYVSDYSLCPAHRASRDEALRV